MMKLDIQLFGGRGASSSYGKEGYNTSGNQKPMRFYDKTKIYKGMSVEDFEARTGKFKSEYIGLYDDKGKIIIAGTSYDSGAVAIPTTHPKFKQVNRMTHTHPSGKTRALGGSFSGADVTNTGLLKLKEVRARANEKTYIVRAKKGVRQAPKRLYAVGLQSDKKWDANAKKRLTAIKKRFAKQGKTMSRKVEQEIYLGYGTRYWKRSLGNTGYEYIEVRKKNRRK